MLPKWWHRVPAAWRPALLRWGFNWFPAYRATGGRVMHVSADLRRIVVKLPLNRNTRNAVGTLFGGSLYAATDGLHPTLLMLQLGRDYIVWDKAGAIRYRRPGRAPLFGDFHVSDDDLRAVRARLAADGECEHTFLVELKDRHGLVHTLVERTVYVADKQHYLNKREYGGPR